MNLRRVIVSALALWALLVAPVALSQSSRPLSPPPPAPAPAAPPIPYEPQLLRLAEILGALTFLRDLCGAGDGDKWRAQMAALIASEAVSEERKARLAGSFNRGFRGFEQFYRTCTPNAEIVISRYIREGERIAQDVASRYSGG